MKRKPKKKKQSNADQLSNEIEELLFDIATIADKLTDLLPRFKRLKAKHKRAIYDHMDLTTQQLCATVDDYEDETPPAPGQEKAENQATSRPAGSVDLFGPIVGAFGIAAALGEAARRGAAQDPEWPKELPQPGESNPADPDPEAKHD